MKHDRTSIHRRPPTLRALAARAWTFFLVAWMAFCCCEKRMFADSLGLSENTAEIAAKSDSSSCCGGCCAGAERDDASTDPRGSGQTPPDPSTRHRTCCSDGCCTKASCCAEPWTIDLDSVGTPLPPSILRNCPRDEVAMQDASLPSEPVPRPPPRQVRTQTARSNLAPPDAA
jgi:hypothetical protein